MRKVTLGALSAAVLLTLTACAGLGSTEGQPSSTSEATSSGDSSSDATQSTLKGQQLNLECEDILSLEDMYEYNPNVGSDPSFKATGTASDMVSIGGVACGWMNQTSQDTIEIAVARPDEASRELVLNATANLYEAVPTYGTPPEVEGYFGLEGSVGVATVFADGYWIELRSVTFYEPGDVTPLVEMVLGNL